MPSDTPTTIVLLTLNFDDSVIFKFLTRKGKNQKNMKELTIMYVGKPIYNKRTKTFMFGSKEYVPTAIHVESCSPQLN